MHWAPRPRRGWCWSLSNRADAGGARRVARAHGVPAEVLADPADGGGLARSGWRATGSTCWCWPATSSWFPPPSSPATATASSTCTPRCCPAFGGRGMYGRRVHEAVLASGARESGATVHLVDEVYDRGRDPRPGPGARPARRYAATARGARARGRAPPAARGRARRRRGRPPRRRFPKPWSPRRESSVMPRALISVSDKRGHRRLRPGPGPARLGDHLHRRHRGGAPDRRASRSRRSTR